MTLGAGTTLGSFEILGLLGIGGMGEVYRARDTRLHREVAIKVLPAALTTHPGRLERLEREARVLASLNHPHIAGIYGLEESGSVRALVLELVEGQTLADRMMQGPVPVDRALQMALQIAQAVEAAHHKGVVHRDLKPSNIKVTPEGHIKVLDFGLAKALSSSSDDLLTNDAAGPTQTGAIIGTPAYMSPEQARGQAASFQSDIWSFGVVLYELLIGASPFQRPSTAETLARVLDAQPDFSVLPPNTPDIARRLIRRCLEKDQHRRLQHMGDIRIDLEEALASPGASLASLAQSPGAKKRAPRWRWVALTAAVAAIAGAAGWFVATRPNTERTGGVVRASIAFLDSEDRQPYGNRQIAISPAGDTIAFASMNRLWVRRLDQEDATAIGATGDDPFFSPDGQWIGLFAASGVLKVPVGGGAPTLVAQSTNRPAGGAWRSDGTIVFANTEGVYQVPANGGEPRLLVKPERDRQVGLYAWPEFLPDGQSVLLTVLSTDPRSAPDIAVLDLTTLARKVVVKGGASARYVPSGHLVYASGTVLKAVAFDLNARETRGESVTFPQPEVTITPDNGAASFAVSDSGTLVFGRARGATTVRNLVWIDRHGKEELLAVEPRDYFYPRVSPDGSRVAVERFTNGNRDIWILDLKRLTQTQLTDGPTEDLLPVWAPDGQRIWFGSNRTGDFDIYSQAADGATGARLEFASPGFQAPMALTPDGKGLTVQDRFQDVALLDLARPDRLHPLLNTAADERLGQVSPDGQWVAYESDESGTQFEIMLRPFPDVSQRRFKISINGGRYPRWGPKASDELYYVDLDGGMMAASITLSPTFTLGKVTKLFEWQKPPPGRTGMPYDISMIDGRFLTVKAIANDPDGSTTISLVLNWLTELPKRVPTY